MSKKIWGVVGLSLMVALVVAVILMSRKERTADTEKSSQAEPAKQPLQTEDQMKDKTLTCDFEVNPAGDGEYSMAFTLHNLNNHPVTVRYFKPYTDFELTVEADNGPVPLVQPAYDVGVQPMDLTVDGKGGEARISTPIRLRFDPDVAPSGGDVATLWTLRHAPASVRLRATLRLGGAKVEPCEASLDPAAKK